MMLVITLLATGITGWWRARGPDEARSELERLTRYFAASSYSVNTLKGYATHVRAYVAFCVRFGYEVLPASDSVLSQFYVFQSQTCTPDSLKTYTSGIRAFHLENGYPWPHVSTRILVHRTMLGIKRVFGAPAKPKLAVSLEHLLDMRIFLNFDDANDVMWWAAALVAFFLSLRKDNVTCEKENSWNARSNLCRGDFAPALGWERVMEGPLWVQIRSSKTNQSGMRVHYVPLIPIPGSPLCPVTAVVRAFSVHPDCGAAQPAFSTWTGGAGAGRARAGRFSPMTHSVFVRRFKVLIKDIGLNPADYSGHSFRRGAATLGFTLTDRHELIKYLGDWRSDAYLGYNQMSVESKCLLPELMAQYAIGLSRA